MRTSELSQTPDGIVDDIELADEGFARPVGDMRPPAKAPAVRQFAERLAEQGQTEDGALALARAVVDPADARRRLQTATALHVPGGALLTITVPVWAHAVIPHPANTREASNRRYPIAVPPGSSEAAKFPPPREVEASEQAAAELTLRMQSREHMVWALDRSSEYLEQANNLQDSIARQGVMLPITVSVLQIVHDDGTPPIFVAAANDGSSRLASCHKLLGITAEEIAYDLPADDRRFRRTIERLLAPYGLPFEEVSEDELVFLRALQLPATLIVGFRSDDDLDVDFAEASRSYVGMLHVEPPKEWDEAAARDAKADSVLHELLTDDLITEDERDFLAGMLTPAEATDRGFSEHLDHRAAMIFRVFTSTDPRLWKAVGRGIKRVSAKVRIRREERAAVAAELAMRAVRNGPLGNRIKTTRAALERALRVSLFWGTDTWGVSRRSPEELRDAALGEVREGKPGEATIELAALALFWLTAYNVLTRESGNTIDQRSPQQLLTRLTESEHGVALLYQTIADGRAGTPPRAPKADGKVMMNPAGQAIPTSDQWLRRAFPVASTSGTKPTERSATPTQELDVRRRAVRAVVERLETGMDEMKAVRGVNGSRLVEEDGFPSDVADDLNKKLNGVVRELTRYGLVWDQRLPTEGSDGNDEEPQEVEA